MYVCNAEVSKVIQVECFQKAIYANLSRLCYINLQPPGY